MPIKGQDAYLQRDYSHYAYVPGSPPTDVELAQATHNVVARSNLALGRLDFAVRRLPDPRMLVRPVLRREAQRVLQEITGASYGRIFVCPLVRNIVLRP